MIHPIKIKLVLGLEKQKKEDRLVLSEDFFLKYETWGEHNNKYKMWNEMWYYSFFPILSTSES